MLSLALTTFAVTFTTFLPMIDPFGSMSIFAVMTDGMPKAAQRRVALRACAFALTIVLGFGFFGQELLELFGITTNGLKIVGGIIFLIMGYDMLQARLARTKVSDPPTPHDDDVLDDLALTPLGIPLLAGPGAITNAVIRAEAAQGIVETAAFAAGTFAVMAFTCACLLGATTIAKWIGPSGSKVILRLMGLILMVIAVESFFDGLTPIVRQMLAPTAAG